MPDERPILSYSSPLGAPGPRLSGEFVVTFAPVPIWPAMVREGLILALLLYGLAIAVAVLLDRGSRALGEWDPILAIAATILICVFMGGRIRRLVRSVRFSGAPTVIRISPDRLHLQAPSQWSAGTLSEPLDQILACEIRRDWLMLGGRYLLQIDTTTETIKIPIALESAEFIQRKAADLRNAIDRYKMER